jgi:NADPH:quinone reductase-like Zn-dependent oxidoreductase
MKAVVFDTYGPADVLRIVDVERPVPAEDELLVRVHATTVNRTDCGLRAAKPFITRFFTGLLRPKYRTPGMEFAGEVEAVGAGVTDFAVGDAVFGVRGSGANAEYVCIKQSGPVAHKPERMTFTEAAGVADGACSALSCLRGADLRPGRTIAVYGATGSIGTAAVQIARHFGAQVTAIVNTKNIDLAHELGADHVLDWEREDFTRTGQSYDVIFDSVGKLSFRRVRRALRDGGQYIATDPGFWWHTPIVALLTKWVGSRKAKLGIARYRQADVRQLQQLLEAGEYRPVIDRTYPLEDVVEATRYVETEQKTGNVVLTVDDRADST